MKDLYKQVENNMDDLVDNQVWWSNCATAEQMDAAKNGSLEITLGGSKPLPKDWIAHISGKKVLCLAGAGGLQAPPAGQCRSKSNGYGYIAENARQGYPHGAKIRLGYTD